VRLKDIVEKTRAFLKQRQLAYQRTFSGVAGETVLADLAKFCRAHDTTFHSDARMSAVLQGRHEVWTRIAQHVRLTDEQIWKLYGAPHA
jgi:hypothetical protein